MSKLTNFFLPTGNAIVPVYEPVMRKGYVVELKECGKRDFQAEIESWRDSCDINVIMQRLANGDDSMLRSDGRYMDVSDLPKTLAEAFNMTRDFQDIFESLSPDDRAKFGGYDDFLTAIASLYNGEKPMDNLDKGNTKTNKSEVNIDGSEP